MVKAVAVLEERGEAVTSRTLAVAARISREHRVHLAPKAEKRARWSRQQCSRFCTIALLALLITSLPRERNPQCNPRAPHQACGHKAQAAWHREPETPETPETKEAERPAHPERVAPHCQLRFHPAEIGNRWETIW